jgi:hypothetical protein
LSCALTGQCSWCADDEDDTLDAGGSVSQRVLTIGLSGDLLLALDADLKT